MAREAPWFIMHLAGQASPRWPRVTSNVSRRMRRIALAGTCAVLSACMPVAPRVYVPSGVDVAAVNGRTCEPNYKSELFAEEGVVVSIVLLPRSDRLAGSIQVDVPAGKNVRFTSPKLEVASVGSAQLGPGRWRPTERIEGFALAEFPFALSLPTSPSEISVQLPQVEVGGTEHQPKPVVFALQRKAMIIGLCQ